MIQFIYYEYFHEICAYIIIYLEVCGNTEHKEKHFDKLLDV